MGISDSGRIGVWCDRQWDAQHVMQMDHVVAGSGGSYAVSDQRLGMMKRR